MRKKVLEEAVVHRKRSSRIAVKESVREAERAEARRRAEEEKEMERHKRWEARARKEEEERIKRENLRSTRLREKGRTGSERLALGSMHLGILRTNSIALCSVWTSISSAANPRIDLLSRMELDQGYTRTLPRSQSNLSLMLQRVEHIHPKTTTLGSWTVRYAIDEA